MSEDPGELLDVMLENLVANQEDGMTLDEAWAMLEALHEATGADFHIRLESAAHCGWQAEIRLTPVPHNPDTSDVSYVTFRAGPAEWALCQAVLDMFRLLARVQPEYATEPCLDCATDDDLEGAQP